MNSRLFLIALALISLAIATNVEDERLRICGAKLNGRIQTIKGNCSAETARFAPLSQEKREAIQQRGIAKMCCFSGCTTQEITDLTCR